MTEFSRGLLPSTVTLSMEILHRGSCLFIKRVGGKAINARRISNDILPQMKVLNMVILILLHLCSFSNKSRCKPHIAASHPTKCDVIIDVKLFPKVYRRKHCRKFLTLSNQTSRYKNKRIRIMVYRFYCMALYHS